MQDLIKRLRSTSHEGFNKHWELHLKAADLIEKQAAQIEMLREAL